MNDSIQTVPATFARGSLTLAAELHMPGEAARGEPLPAIVISTPGSSVKEQIGATYARVLAARGYVVLTFDPAFQGQSTGEPRDLESPVERVADLRSAVDFMSRRPEVDRSRLAMLGICAGGGYAVAATLTDRRVKALGTVVASDIGTAFRNMAAATGGVSAVLDEVARQAGEEAAGRPPAKAHWIPDSVEEARAAGLDDVDLMQAIDYYRTSRGRHPRSTNRRHYASDAFILGFDAFNLVDTLLTQPVQVIVAGASRGTTGSFEDGHRLASLATAAEPVFAVQGARHYEMYDTPGHVDQAVRTLDAFYRRHLR